MISARRQPDAYAYSILRAVPDPARGECVNLGVILIAPDGHYSDLRIGSLSRVRKLDATADLDSIRAFVAGLSGALPMHGSQTLVDMPSTPVNVETLMTWSREFGGAVQISEPRSVLASDPAAVLDHLFKTYVAGHSEEPSLLKSVERTPSRARLLGAFDHSVALWGQPGLRVIAGATVRGRHAHHRIDRLLQRNDTEPLAIVEAISFGGKDLTEIFGRRATICLAAEDLHRSPRTRSVSAFAVHTSASSERAELVAESAELFRENGVTPVLLGDFEAIRQATQGGELLQ